MPRVRFERDLTIGERGSRIVMVMDSFVCEYPADDLDLLAPLQWNA